MGTKAPHWGVSAVRARHARPATDSREIVWASARDYRPSGKLSETGCTDPRSPRPPTRSHLTTRTGRALRYNAATRAQRLGIPSVELSMKVSLKMEVRSETTVYRPL